MFAPYGLEDVDLCLKVRRQGLRVVYNPLSTVLHHGSVTLSQSAPGAIPRADTRGFEDRWPRHLLESDDERFYREDGFSIRSMRDGQVELDENITESNRLVDQAMTGGLPSPASANVDCLRKALDLYPHNVRALHALVTVHRRRGECAEALRCAEILRRVEPGNFERHLAAVELAFLSGKRERAAQVLEHVARLPCLPAAISERMELLQQKLV
jgi:hypothetical protein